MKTPIHNLEAKLEFAAQMRRHPTAAEATLWYRLKKRQTGFVFHRQSVQRGYILDFYCPSAKLAIEVDGSIHELKAEQDAAKEQALTDWGITVLRFSNQDVLDFMPVVMARIEATLKAFSSLRFGSGGRTNDNSNSSRPSASLQNSARTPCDDRNAIKRILNLPENLCRPKQMPDEQRITPEAAHEVVAACKKLMASVKQRSQTLRCDNRTMAERAFDQKYRLEEWLKKRSESAESAALAVKGMHVTDAIQRKA